MERSIKGPIETITQADIHAIGSVQLVAVTYTELPTRSGDTTKKISSVPVSMLPASPAPPDEPPVLSASDRSAVLITS